MKRSTGEHVEQLEPSCNAGGNLQQRNVVEVWQYCSKSKKTTVGPSSTPVHAQNNGKQTSKKKHMHKCEQQH